MNELKITKITPQKKGQRYNIYLNDEFALGIDEEVYLSNGLRVGQLTTLAEIEGLAEADTLARCLNKAYHFLSFRPRSEKETTDKLAEKFELQIVAQVIAKLKEQNYINDGDFVDFWIRARAHSHGPAAIKSELQKKGIARELLEQKIDTIKPDQELEAALELVKSKRKFQEIDKARDQKTLAPYLARRGYSYATIKAVLKNRQETV